MTTFPQISRFEREIVGRTIDLPLRGKVYKFPANVSVDLGLKFTVLREETFKLKAAADAGIEYEVDERARELIDESGESFHDIYFQVIGEERRAELEADGVTWAEIVHIGQTLMFYHTAGPEVALLVWQSYEADEADARPPAGPSTPPGGSRRRKKSRSSSRKRNPSGTRGQGSTGNGSSTPGT